MDILSTRLDQIAAALARTPQAIALVVVGSLGHDDSRKDAYSDLDFFVITKEGEAKTLIADLSWLASAYSVKYFFKNTRDGYKILFSDGIYSEFAVFNSNELINIPYTNARLHWLRPGCQLSLEIANKIPIESKNVDYYLNEALCNLYVGLSRYRRQEYYSSYLFICHYALTNILKAQDRGTQSDPFDISRRLEKSHPELIPLLQASLQGYTHILESARTIASYLSSHINYPNEMMNQVLFLLKSLKEEE